MEKSVERHKAMITIGLRLFGAVLLAFLSVGGIGLTLARWSLADGVPVPNSPVDEQALAALAADVQAHYASRGNWSFLPPDAEQRRDWLRVEFQRLRPAPGNSTAGGRPPSSTFGDRLGLLDATGRRLAGRVPSRALIAAASIDTRVHALKVDGAAIGRLIESRADQPDDELAVAFLLAQQRNLTIIAGVCLVSSVLVAAALAAHFRQPIRRLAEGARALESGRLDTRLPTGRRDELGHLAEAFNHLAARLEAAEVARVQWVADTSHELRTPVAIVRGQIEALQDGVRLPTPEHLALMLRQILALTRLVDDLGELAQPDVGAPRHDMRPVDVWPLVEDVAASFAEKARIAGLQIDIGAAPARSTVSGDALRLRQVLCNLFENSVRYTAAGGRIEIRAQALGETLRLSIADSAPGVPSAALDHLGDRFFRVEPSRSRATGGSGLGLALCRRIIEAHGGQVAFAPAAIGGLQVDVLLPLES